jgi:microcystin degradation protein MlrC
VPTPLASFGPDGPILGAAAYTQAMGTRTELGAFINAAERRGAQLTGAVNATANPSGRVADDAYARLRTGNSNAIVPLSMPSMRT